MSTAAAIAADVRAGRRDQRDVAEQALAQVATRNPAINALISVDQAQVMADAEAAVGHCGAMAGVPLIVKDNIWVRDRRITQGSRLFADFPVPADAVAAFSDAGLAMEAADPDWTDAADEAQLMPLQAAGLAALHGARWQAEPALFDPDLGARIETGLGLSGTDVARALDAGRAIRATLGAMLARFDLLLCPTAPCVAWPLERLGPAHIGGVEAGPRGHAVFTRQANHARIPALSLSLSLPCGRGRGGLPVGPQIMAGFGRDRTLLAAAGEAGRVLHNAGLWP